MISSSVSVLAGRAKLAIIAAWAVVATTLILIVIEGAEVLGLVNPLYPSDSWAEITLLGAAGYTIAFVLSVILVAMWIHRAHAHLYEVGREGLEFTPGWAVGWYFVPFANLVQPYKAMQELWHASIGNIDDRGDGTPREIKIWWATWLVGNILSNISLRMSSFTDAAWIAPLVGVISSALLLVCAWLLIDLMRKITFAQEGLGTAEVFA